MAIDELRMTGSESHGTGLYRKAAPALTDFACVQKRWFLKSRVSLKITARQHCFSHPIEKHARMTQLRAEKVCWERGCRQRSSFSSRNAQFVGVVCRVQECTIHKSWQEGISRHILWRCLGTADGVNFIYKCTGRGSGNKNTCCAGIRT